MMNEELTFAPADMEDAQVIFTQSKALVDAYEDTSAIPYEKVLAWLEEKIRQNIAQYVKISKRGETVGFYRLFCENGEIELDDFYVLPKYRGQGIGTKVLEKCIRETDDSMFLYVFKKNEGAIRLYERFGFAFEKDVSETRMILRRKG